MSEKLGGVLLRLSSVQCQIIVTLDDVENAVWEKINHTALEGKTKK